MKLKRYWLCATVTGGEQWVTEAKPEFQSSELKMEDEGCGGPHQNRVSRMVPSADDVIHALLELCKGGNP